MFWRELRQKALRSLGSCGALPAFWGIMHKVRWHSGVHNLGTESAVKVSQEGTNWHRLSPHPTQTGCTKDEAIRMDTLKSGRTASFAKNIRFNHRSIQREGSTWIISNCFIKWQSTRKTRVEVLEKCVSVNSHSQERLIWENTFQTCGETKMPFSTKRQFGWTYYRMSKYLKQGFFLMCLQYCFCGLLVQNNNEKNSS